MSATGTKLDLAEADKIAASLLKQIDGEAHVVGSVRRRRPTVGDIEIMVHRHARINISASTALFPGEFETVKGGKGDWRFWQLLFRAGGYNVDLYRFDDDNRGSIMLIRTGPAEFSKRFVIALRAGGLVHSEGYIHVDNPFGGVGVTMRCPTEGVAFSLAGMEYVGPEARA